MNSQRFEGKVAVITGGNSGIGLASAKAFAHEGALVAITGRDEKTLQQAAKELGPKSLALAADVSKLADLDRVFAKIKERFGKIDALFVNAGVGKFLPFDQVSEAFFDETMNINLKGAFFTVQKAAPLMSSGSTIVLNASINAHLGMPGSSVYGATKAAVVNLAKTLSADLIPRGIRVNAVTPGPITTPIIDRMGLSAEDTQKTKDWIQSQVPLKRFGSADEVANAVLYLSSPESAYVVGTEIIIDGGMATL